MDEKIKSTVYKIKLLAEQNPEFYQEDTDCTLKIRVFSETMSVEAECPAETGATLTLKLPQIRPWSPEDPFLYDVEYTLQNRKGEILDRVRGYAGLRKIHIEHGQVYLNNKVLFQRLVLDQGVRHIALPPAPFVEEPAEVVGLGVHRALVVAVRDDVKVLVPGEEMIHVDELLLPRPEGEVVDEVVVAVPGRPHHMAVEHAHGMAAV